MPLIPIAFTFRIGRLNALSVADFTYVHNWAEFVYVTPSTNSATGVVIDASAHRIVGWKASASATAGFVLNVIEPAIHAKRPTGRDEFVRHSHSRDAGSTTFDTSCWGRLGISC